MKEDDEIKRKQVGFQATDLGSRQIQFKISTQGEDRDGDILIAAGCDLEQFNKNPQFLGFHNRWDYPLGKVLKCWIDNTDKSVKAIVYFPTLEELSSNPEQASEKAKQVDFTYYCYKTGMMKAVSVGFRIKEYQNKENNVENNDRGLIITKWELMEFSAVPVPANPDALAEGIKSFDPDGEFLSIFDIQNKGAIPYKKYPLADEKTTWDGSSVIKNSSVDDLKKICTWVADKNADDLTKSDFKLPHHLGAKEGYKTVWGGVSAAMAAILGARGGVNIPDADKDKCYNHLAKHYKEFGKDVPDKSVSDLYKKAYEDNNEDKIKSLNSIYFDDDTIVIKSGAKYSKSTKELINKIKSCHTKMAACHEEMKDLLKQFDDMPDDSDDSNSGDKSIDFLDVDDKNIYIDIL